jgi:glutathionylspermidine synthase
MGLPWECGEPLPSDCFDAVLRRAVFDCCKWDNQVEDQALLCPFPLVLDAATWDQLASAALSLAGETLAAEQELLGRTDLHSRLGLPGPLRRSLGLIPARGPTAGAVRVMRFDFHWTAEGWRISEANTDVASGFIEASGFTSLLAAHYPGWRPAGDPAGVLAAAIGKATGNGARVALMHLTVFADDRQIMLYLARRLAEHGLQVCLCSPEQLRWSGGKARVVSDGHTGPVDLVVRFFPADWLIRLPTDTSWDGYQAGGRTPVCNPGYAVLTQSKRFPLTWDALHTSLPTWHALLPETRSPREVSWPSGDDWVIKPALGHEGNDVAMTGVTDPAEWKHLVRSARKHPEAWAVQRRFQSLPLPTPDGWGYPCLGVYVIDGQVAGAYGRMGRQPLTDYRAREIAVLVR